MRAFRPIVFAVCIAAGGLLLAACGSSSNKSTPTTDTGSNAGSSPTAQGSATPAAPTAASPGSTTGGTLGAQTLTPALFDKATATADGLKIVDETEGTGPAAKAGDTVTVDYFGAFTDGKKFDASADHGSSGFQFVLGQGSVIKGWDEGLVGMKAGGTRFLYVPYQLAYGTRGYGPIPPNSDLIFEVRLNKIG
jgi:peptidylprolyl isomerase